MLGDRTDDFPWDRFIIFTITGTEADKDCAITEKVVIPTDLIDVLQKTTLNGQPVLEEPNTLVSQTISIEKSGWLTPMVLACILLLLAVISCSWLQRPLSILLLALQLVLGLAVTYLVIFSALPNTSFSWLIVPLNPLPFLLWRWRRWWLLPFALICICWSIAMLVRIWNPLVDNAYIVFALALAINYIGQLNQLRKYSNK